MTKQTSKSKKKAMNGMSGMELQASICPSEVTAETVKQYGYDFKDIDQNGYHLIEFDLMLLDEPCHPVVEGELEGQVNTFVFPSMYADSQLASLKNKPIIINSDFSGHYDVVDGEKEPTVVGSLLGGRITDNDQCKKVVRCLGGLFNKSLPKKVEEIQARKNILGASFELNPTELEIDSDSLSARVKAWVYKGAAILEKALAAFPDTCLLLAQGATNPQVNNEDLAEGRTNMDKIYTQEEFDAKAATLVAEAVKTKETELATANAETLKAKDTEISTLKAQAAEKDTNLAAKDATIVSVTNKINEISNKMQENEINASLTDWWKVNEKLYDPKDKEVILSARKAVLKKEATTEQIDSLITARRSETKPADLLGSGILQEGKDLDLAHGIRAKEGWKRN